MKNKGKIGNYVLNTTNLERGDIILTTAKDRTSKIIRFVTFGPFSHAMIYLGVDSCADAGGIDARVASHNTQRIFFDSPEHCCVLRLKNGLNENQADNIVNYARRFIGMEYSIDEAILVALRVNYSAKEINRQFCSRYVAQAYADIGINLVDNTDYCSPAELFNSSLLDKVENHLREVGEEEKLIFLEQSKSMQLKDYADDYIFSNAKQLSGIDIQTDEQFNTVLIQHPHLDAQFSQILKDSYFLDLWRFEQKENPEIYNFNLLQQKCNDNDNLKQLGWNRLPIEQELRRGWNLTLDGLKGLYKNQKLITLKLQIDLYEKLIELSFVREDVWNQCVNL